MIQVEPYSQEYYDRIDTSSKKLKTLLRAVLKYKPIKVLDVGCGHGYLVKELLKSGVEAIGIDFSEFTGKEIPDNFIKIDATLPFPFKDKEFDVVISSDFFEHLKEEQIEPVYQEMLRVGKKVIALICFKVEKISWSHLTVKPREWWQEKLKGVEIL